MTTNNPLYKSDQGYAIMQAAYDLSVAQWPVPPERRTVSTRLGETHVLIAGDPSKPPLVYFHGWNGNASGTHVELDVARLTERYCIYAPDIPGHTGRSVQVRPATRGRAYVEWVYDLFGALGIERAYLVGVSGGGYMTMKTCAHLGERVFSAYGVVPHGIPAAKQPPPRFFRIVLASLLRGKGGAAYLVKRMGSPHKENDFDPQFMMWINKYFKAAMNPAPLTDDELRMIQCPVQVTFGGLDITMNVNKTVDRAHRLIAGVEVEVLADEGHLLSPDAWQRINDAMMAWLA